MISLSADKVGIRLSSVVKAAAGFQPARRMAVLGLAVLAAVGALLSGCSRRPANLVHVSGNIELTQVDMSFKTAGRLVERRFDEGATVKKGDIVAQLDRDQLAQQENRDVAGIASADSQYQQLQTSIAMQRETLAGDIAAHQADLAQAQAHLDELLNGSRPQEIQQSRAGASDARAQYQLAKDDWDRAQTLFKSEDISRQQYEQYLARFHSAEAILHEAEHRLSLVEEGPRKEDIAAARDQVAAAAQAVKLAEANRLELQRKQQQVAQQKAAIEQARAQAGITGVMLSDTTIFSPIDGVVLVKSAEPGEVLAAGTTVLTIGDIDHPWLRGYISEGDLGRVKLGQRASVTNDSFKGKTYNGRVSFIASDAEFTPKQIQTNEERVKLVYRIKIDVENPQHELKNNMPVDADIQVAE
jgi:HlyD family secretion protein